LALTALAIGLIVIMAALALWAIRRLPTQAQGKEQAAEREYEQAA
jgi:Tfp pilus assembly protein PilW